MNTSGIGRAVRYAYPPNSFALCGPDRQADLSWYSQTQETDRGTEEIIAAFSTLYPYLRLIAGENARKDPFDPDVVDAYWIGNDLLTNVASSKFIAHLDESLTLRKRLARIDRDMVYTHVAHGGLPNHAFHVLNVPMRTGHLPISATVTAMDACLIHWGKVIEIEKNQLTVLTNPLIMEGSALTLGRTVKRTLNAQGEKDVIFRRLRVGDSVSYHWGYVCEKLDPRRRRNLQAYTKRALAFANNHL